MFQKSHRAQLLAIRTADRAVTEIPVGEQTHGIAVHPSGSFMYAGGTTNVHVIDAATNAVVDVYSVWRNVYVC